MKKTIAALLALFLTLCCVRFPAAAADAPYQLITDPPELFTKRLLSDDEIMGLKDADLETLRQQIATFADFAAWIDTQAGEYWSNVTSDPKNQRTYGAEFVFFYWQQGLLCTPAADSLAVHILGDDYPGMGQIVAAMDEGSGVVLSGTVIPAEDGYYVYSPDRTCRLFTEGNCMDEGTPLLHVKELTDLVSFYGSPDDPAAPGGVLTQLFYLPGDAVVALDYQEGTYIPQDSGAVELYKNGAFLDTWEEQVYGHIKPENIGAYQLSQMLGGTTLTVEEAYALPDCTPEEVKERVKTAGDLLMYMLAAQICDCGGDFSEEIDGNEWHYNMSAFEVMESRTGNCGSAANLANYLLEGDYEEIGFILHAYPIGEGGGHVYNYIRYQGHYYIMDFSWYIFANYRPEQDFPVLELNSLEEYGTRAEELYGSVCLVIAHTSPGKHLPNVFDDAAKAYALPQGSTYTVLYQEDSPNSYRIAEYPLDRSKLDWESFE